MNLVPKETLASIYGDLGMDAVNIAINAVHNNIDDVNSVEPDKLVPLLQSRLWRLNNLYTIADKKGNLRKFKMNYAQHIVYSKFIKHPRLIILKSRQQGISTLILVLFFDIVVFFPHQACGIMSIVEVASKELMERIKLLWNTLPSTIKELSGLSETSNSASCLSLSNQSRLFCKTSFRGSALQAMHVSELGKIANDLIKLRELKTGSMQTVAPNQPLIIESTAEGANEFKVMWDKAMAILNSGVEFSIRDFFPIFLSWLDDPDCNDNTDQSPSNEDLKNFKELEKAGLIITQTQRNFWVQKRAELGSEDIYREYPATPEQAFKASDNPYFWQTDFVAKVVEPKHILPTITYNERYPIFVSQDLGVSDYYVLLFFQYYNGNIYILEDYKNTGQHPKFYAQYIIDRFKELNVASTNYELIFPHDAVKIDLMSEGKKRSDVFYEMGLKKHNQLGRDDRLKGVELVRQYIPNIYLNNAKAYYSFECFMNYKKRKDKANNILTSDACKDKYCHGADAIRYMIEFINTHKNRITDPSNFSSKVRHTSDLVRRPDRKFVV